MSQSIIAAVPTDREGLAKHMLELGLSNIRPIPSISDKHVAVHCDGCGRECWIGRNQAKMFVLMPTPVLCYFCIMTALHQGQSYDTAALDD